MGDLQDDDMLSGKKYELAVFMLTLINNPRKNFDLGKEIKFGDKWDDLVVKLNQNYCNLYTFLQFKLVDHSDKDDNLINSKVLLGKEKISLAENDFKLQKYFISYLRIKDQLNSRGNKSKIQRLILFTNARLNEKEINQNVGTLYWTITNENDIVPNTDKGLKSCKICKLQNTFVQAMMKDIKSDFESIVEELFLYATSEKKTNEPMTLDKDYFAYYNKALIDENVIEIVTLTKTKKSSKKESKRGKFTDYFIDGKCLSPRANRLRNRLFEIITKKGNDIKEVLETLKTRDWIVSENFDEKKTDDVIFLPNYDIKTKDITNFFDVLEFRTNQLLVEDITRKINDNEIKKHFLESFDTDPRIVNFLIRDFIQCRKSTKANSEMWILSADRSNFIAELKAKISKPKVVFKTQEYVKYLKGIMEKFGLYFDDNFCFCDNYFKNTFSVVKTVSPILSSVKMLQYLECKNWKDYIFLDMDSPLLQKELIKLINAFENDKVNVLILSYKVITSNTINELLEKIYKIIKKNKGKKIIFITRVIEDSIIQEIKAHACINEHTRYVSVYVDNTVELRHLENGSKIFDINITINGQDLTLSDFLEKDKTNCHFITTEILERFIKNGNIKINHKQILTSYLNEAYTEVIEEVDKEVLVDELLSNDSNNIHVFSCVSNTEKELILSLESGINAGTYTNIQKKTKVLNQQLILNISKKRIQISDYQFTEPDFKKICHMNSDKTIYWYKITQGNKKPTFLLLQIYNPNFYFEGQRFNTKVIFENSIRELLLSNELSEMYLIFGAPKPKIENWLQLSSLEENKIFNLNCKNNKIRILQSRENHEIIFQEIVQHNPNETLHLLNFKDDQLTWVKSHGTLKHLSKCRASDYKNSTPLLNENDLIEAIKSKKIIIIAADPGMGKSTTLVKLYESKYTNQSGIEESIAKSHWLIHFNLKDNLQTIRGIDFENSNIVHVLMEIASFLLEIDDKVISEFAKHLFVNTMLKEYNKKPILIVVDELDEISTETDRNQIIRILKYLNDKTTVKIWISTRHHHENTIVSAFSTFAVKIVPLSGDDIHKFIHKYLKSNLRLILSYKHYNDVFGNINDVKENTKIDAIAKAISNKIQKMFLGDVSKLIGTPLHLFLILENSAKNWKMWLNDDSTETFDVSYLGRDLWTIYENFVAKKYNTYFRKVDIKENLHQKLYIKNFNDFHKDLASLIKVPKDFYYKYRKKQYLEEFKDLIISAGITKCFGTNIEFIHPTFSEYFVASEIIDWLDEWKLENICEMTSFPKQNFFLKELLLKPDHNSIRAFLNEKLLKERFQDVKLQRELYDPNILLIAAKENRTGIASFILDNVQDVDVNPNVLYNGTILENAAGCGHLDMVMFLIERGCKLKDCEQSVLHYAVTSYNLKLVEFLVHIGADVNEKDSIGRPVLQMETSREIVEFLIDKGADINSVNCNNGVTILQSALNFSKYDISEFLIIRGANVNSKDHHDNSVLHSAAQSENSKLVSLLLERGANIKAKNCYNMTVLHSAAEFGDLQTVKLLIKEGVDVMDVDYKGKTALHFAAESGNYEIVEYLVREHNFDCNNVDNEGETVLHYAVNSDNLDLVKFVVNYTKDINLRANNGKTALHNASMHGNEKIVEFLLTQNIDITITDENGRTALELVKPWQALTHIVHLLQVNEKTLKI